MHGQDKIKTLCNDELQRRLLNDFQRGFPVSATPYKDIAEQLGISEAEVLDKLEVLKADGFISRVGAVFKANSVGVSTLGAMTVPEAELEHVATMINAYEEVNHNYEREHRYNLWFVVTAADEVHLQNVLADIELCTGHAVLYLPMLRDYHIDLGFDLKWT